MQPNPPTDIFTNEEHVAINEIAENLVESDNVDYSNCGNKPDPVATDILTDEQHIESKKLNEENLARMMKGMMDNINDPNNPYFKRMKEYHNKHTMFNIALFIGMGLVSVLGSTYIYKHIKENRNVKLDIILYVSAFIIMRTIYMGATYYYLTTNGESSSTLIKFSNMSFSVIKILSIIAMIFVVGLAAFLDLRLVPMCILYVVSEMAILYTYFSVCGGCCH